MLRIFLAVATAVLVLALPTGAFAMYGPSGGSTPASTSSSGGFGYRDAAIGAAAGVLALTVVGGVVLVTRRHGRHVPAGTRA